MGSTQSGPDSEFVVPARPARGDPRALSRGSFTMSPMSLTYSAAASSPATYAPALSPIVMHTAMQRSTSSYLPASSGDHRAVASPRRLPTLAVAAAGAAATTTSASARGTSTAAATMHDNESLALRCARQALLDGCTMLDLSARALAAEEVGAIAKALARGPGTLRVLRLDRNHIRGAGAGFRRIAACLSSVPLQTLVLSHNAIGDCGVEALAAALMKNKSLTSLALGGNGIGVAGARALAPLLVQETCTLQQLHLPENSALGDAGVAIIAASLARNESVRTLDLHDTSMTAHGAAALAMSLGHHPRLSVLYVGSNSVGDEGAFPLACLVQTSPSLTSLYADGCGIGDAGSHALLRAARRSETLAILSVKVWLRACVRRLRRLSVVVPRATGSPVGASRRSGTSCCSAAGCRYATSVRKTPPPPRQSPPRWRRGTVCVTCACFSVRVRWASSGARSFRRRRCSRGCARARRCGSWLLSALCCDA